jgi:acyl-CoA thioester hydrolase
VHLKKILTYRGTVYPWHCDHMGHMNVMFYVSKFDEATWNLLGAVGITASYLRDTQSGAVAVQQNITYKRELLPGDGVDVWSRVVSIEAKKITFLHEMVDSVRNELCAVCEITGVHIDSVGRRSKPFPPEINSRVEEMFSTATECLSE